MSSLLPPTLFYILLFILGASLGSFLSVPIHRIHTGDKGILLGKSACPHCNKKLGPKELVPIFSYLFQGGKCGKCKGPISWHYPVLELSTGLLFVAMAAMGMDPLPLYLFYVLVLIFIFFYDLLYKEIPDVVMLPSILLAFIATFHPATVTVWNGLLGAFVLMFFFFVQILLSKGKWLGGGDLRIGAFMGLILGFKLTILAVFFGYLIGAVVSVFLLLTGKVTRKTMVAFGPFLVLGTLIAVFYGDLIIDWYLNLILL